MKQYVAGRNVDFKLNSVEFMCKDFFISFPVDEWKSSCKHAKKCEQFFIRNEPTLDTVIDQLIINLKDDSDSDNNFNELISDSEGNLSGIEPLWSFCQSVFVNC